MKNSESVSVHWLKSCTVTFEAATIENLNNIPIPAYYLRIPIHFKYCRLNHILSQNVDGLGTRLISIVPIGTGFESGLILNRYILRPRRFVRIAPASPRFSKIYCRTSISGVFFAKKKFQD